MLQVPSSASIYTMTDVEQQWQTQFGAEMQRRRRDRPRGDRRPEVLAASVGRSRAWWINLERGYESRRGVRVSAKPLPDAVARVATALGWDTAEALTLAGFDPADYPQYITGAVDFPELATLPDRLLAHFSDNELLAEVRWRMSHAAPSRDVVRSSAERKAALRA